MAGIINTRRILSLGSKIQGNSCLAHGTHKRPGRSGQRDIYIALSRYLSSTSALGTKQWRASQGLPALKNSEGVLTDGPDYTFLDGRPTPLLHKQKLRMLKQQGFAKKIIELSSEVDFAVEREQNIKKAKEQERQKIINDRLKPKGFALLKKS